MFRPARLYRFFIVLLSTFYFLLSSVAPVMAQSNPYLSPNTESNVPKNLNTTIESVTINVINSLNCQLIGVNPSNPSQKCLGVNKLTGQLGFVENSNGLIGLTTNMIAVLYTPPAHTSDYIALATKDFGIAKPAYAQSETYRQGVGFASIRPLAKMWEVFRDIVYLLFLIVFVVIGMAIMFRVNIDARTVMSIENQIPKIIIGLIMVTFSFGIAGFLIDAMWLTTYVTINVIAKADPQLDVATINNKLYTPPIGFANEVLKGPGENNGILNYAVRGGGSVQSIIGKLFTPAEVANPLNVVGFGESQQKDKCEWWRVDCGIGNLWKNFSVTTLVSKTIGEALSYIVGWLIAYVIGGIAILVFLIAILVALFRLWLALLQAYIFLLIDIVTAPFWILLSLIPNSPLTFSSWLRDMLANLSAFPVAITLIMLGKVFMNSFATTDPNSPFPVPLIGSPGPQSALSPLIGIGMILLVPIVVDLTRKVFKAPQFEYTKAIGQSIGAGTGFAGNVVGGFWGRSWKVNSATGAATGWLSKLATERGSGFIRKASGFILGTHK